MPPITLTEGAIAMLANDEVEVTEIKPVLQVSEVRLVNTQQNNSSERYRVLLSDGLLFQQAMLATQQNELVKTEKLQKGSIIQLTEFVCNKINSRMIIIIIQLDVILDKCDPIGDPKHYGPPRTDGQGLATPRSPALVQPTNQPANPTVTSSYGADSAPRPNIVGGVPPEIDRSAGSHSYGSSFTINADSRRHNPINAPPTYPRMESGYGISRAPTTNYVRPPQPYQQSSPMSANRGPIAKNEAPPRIIPIAALNPYQGRWAIKARVTVKGELRRYSNPRGEGKVFSFDLLDSDGGEIRVTCFNDAAGKFYDQIEPGRVYMISKGTLKPAQKNYNHLRNEHEISLDTQSTVEPCLEDDKSIPQQQFHFRSIDEIESMENNSVLDVIGIVSSISPSSSIMRKNGTETLKRTLQLKDTSGKSVELTLWGSFCNAQGQTLQDICDSGVFPVLAVKSARVNEFNGKAVGTIGTSQLFIDPDFPEAHKLKVWFDKDGKHTPSVSISRETSMVRADVRKTIAQIKDERLGTSEKPDWITVSATLTFIKVENFCYPACPNVIGDRQCNKKVINNGDGKWSCGKCDKSVDECDYRYILQLQIQDHTGLTWVTAFQECGEEIMGISAKDLYYVKYEEQDDDKFAEVIRSVLFTKYMFKLKVREETFSDEQRVKSTAVKAEKINFQTETTYLLDSIAKFKGEDTGFLPPKTENVNSTPGFNRSGFGTGLREPTTPTPNYSANTSNLSRETGLSANQVLPYSNQYGGSTLVSSGTTGVYASCNSCGGSGHTSVNCPKMSNATPADGGASGGGGGGGGECLKCHQTGHWARDCPNLSNATPAYGGASGGGVGVGECLKCHQTGHWARDCPNMSNAPPAYGGASGGGGGECFKCHQTGHWARNCPGLSNAPPSYGSSNSTPGRYGNVPRQHVGGF